MLDSDEVMGSCYFVYFCALFNWVVMFGACFSLRVFDAGSWLSGCSEPFSLVLVYFGGHCMLVSCFICFSRFGGRLGEFLYGLVLWHFLLMIAWLSGCFLCVAVCNFWLQSLRVHACGRLIRGAFDPFFCRACLICDIPFISTSGCVCGYNVRQAQLSLASIRFICDVS